jgi:2-desacetyl-2-hydroxyethyl bacteriochlorophyllide A dehydrogenase
MDKSLKLINYKLDLDGKVHMKGVFFEGKHNLVVKDDLPQPTIQKDEVLIKVQYCGICGSDVESFKTGVLETPGIVIGHEFSGEIVEMGEEVKGWKRGDKVTANPALPCDQCYWCAHSQENLCRWSSALGTTYNGAMAEFINVKAERLFRLPNSISLEEGALIEPLAVALYAVQDSGFKIGKSCTVIGAGGIGLFVIQVLNAGGASQISVLEPVKSKQELALNFGASNVFPPDKWGKINRLTENIGPDYIFDCVGIPDTIMNSMKLIKRGGIITLIGLHTEPFEMKGFMSMVLKSVTMKGVFGYINDTFSTALNLVKNGHIDLKTMITRIVPLDGTPELFEELAEKTHQDIKVLIKI